MVTRLGSRPLPVAKGSGLGPVALRKYASMRVMRFPSFGVSLVTSR